MSVAPMVVGLSTLVIDCFCGTEGRECDSALARPVCSPSFGPMDMRRMLQGRVSPKLGHSAVQESSWLGLGVK